MLFLNFLPDVLKELIKHVPSLMFEIVDWKDLARELSKVTPRLLKKEGYSDFFARQQAFLSAIGVNLIISTSSKEIPTTSDQATGEVILRTYFSQLYSPHGLFIDLRLQHFYNGPDGVTMKPSSLWVTFKDEFRNGLIKMYQGFYYENDTKLEEGLIETGLLKAEWPTGKKDELKSILKNHFAQSLDEGMVFELEHFKNSFVKIANFLINNKVIISHDFIYLGIYLISLYLGLQTIKAPLPVSRIFKEIDAKFEATV